MLVTFRTKRYANITMFGDVAKQLLELMGHSGTVPSAIKTEDVPAALARLESAIEQHRAADGAATESNHDDSPRKVNGQWQIAKRGIVIEFAPPAAAQ